MAADEKGVNYNLDPSAPQTPEQLAQHPWGKVPAMTHNDVKLYETTAITSYIDEAFDGPPLQPSDAADRAKMHQCISVINCYLYPPSIIDIVLQRLVVPQHGGTPDEDKIKAALPASEKALGVINDILSGSNYLVGNSLSLADLFLLPITNYLSNTAPEGQGLISKVGNIRRWQDEMMKRESAKIALA
jgi:glutathione S-transferase